MFFKGKKRIEELKVEVSNLRMEKEELREENSRLKRQLEGEHVTSIYCNNCTHVIRYCFGTACELECKCKDFQSK